MLGVAGASLASEAVVTDRAATAQVIPIVVDPASVRPGDSPDVIFTTDDPIQPTLRLRILDLAAPRKGLP